MREASLTAVTRFGLGPRPGEVARAAGDPRGYVRSQLADPFAAEISDPAVWSEAALRDRIVEVTRTIHDTRQAVEHRADQSALEEAFGTRGRFLRDTGLAEARARYDHGVRTAHPFLERLVLFWANHFSISLKGPVVHATAGHFERTVIRPHVLGFFGDMLRAAVTHPAMLDYLDNTTSIGPHSPVAERVRARGLRPPDVNENLAREILELHTLGVGGGYVQRDVREMAYVLTGWGANDFYLNREGRFAPSRHEPGERTVMGVRYPEGLEEQLYTVLADLAAHPVTARHVCGKLARHVVADAVSPALIDRLAERYLATDGDLSAVARDLVESDEAWEAPPAKFVPPYDFMVSLGRALDATASDGRVVWNGARALAQGLWLAPSPEGWPSEDDAFLGGDALVERVDFARAMASRHGQGTDPRDLARRLFGATLDPYVERAVARAETPLQGLVLLLMSPQLHRR